LARNREPAVTVQRNRTPDRVDALAMKIETGLDFATIEFQPAALEAIFELLDVRASDREGLGAQLRQQANGYRLLSAMLQHQGMPRDTAVRLKRLVHHLEGVEGALSGLSIGMHAQLQTRLTASSDVSVIVLRNQIRQLYRATTLVAEAHKAKEGRPRLIALDTYIALLMLLFERHTGKLPPMSTEWAEANSAKMPSPEAAAILEFFKAVDDAIGRNTIASRIVEVRRRYRGRMLRKTFGHGLFIPSEISVW
jgi:hypothetical protein